MEIIIHIVSNSPKDLLLRMLCTFYAQLMIVDRLRSQKLLSGLSENGSANSLIRYRWQNKDKPCL